MKPKEIFGLKKNLFQKKKQGQALVEYVMLLAVLSGILWVGFKQFPLVIARLEAPLKNQFRRTYKYGDPKTCGYEDDGITDCSGSPVRHPRVTSGGNFRLFGRGGT